MEDQSKLTFKQMLSALLRSNRRHARYIQAFACLAVLVAVAVPLVMRQYGVAMTTTETRLACQYAGNGAHTHNADCYDAYGNLVCPLPEKPFHTHTADCYATERVLTCALPETAGHAHTDACYDEDGNLTCTIPEEPAHTHTDACYETRTTDQLICGMEETTEEHVHGPACFETVTVNVPNPEPETDPAAATPAEPEATVASTPEEDPTPAQEFTDVLKKKDENGNEYVYLVVQVKAPQGALPKGSTMAVAHVDLNKKDDLTGLTAQEKLDEALRKEAGEEAAFVQTDAVDIAFKDAQGNRVDPAKKVEVRITTSTIRTFSDQRTAGDEAVANNSLMVLHVVDRQHTARTNAPDAEVIHEAFLVNQDEDDRSTGHEDTILFEADEFSPYVVARVNNAAVAPEAEIEQETTFEDGASAQDATALPAQAFSHRIADTDGNQLLTVDVLAPEGAFPRGTTMQVAWVDAGQVERAVGEAVAERTDGRLVDLRAVDITFIDPDGNEIEPAKKITVTFSSDLIDTADESYVVHLDDQGKGEVVDALDSKELQRRDIADQADELVIESDAFSTYVVAVTTLHKELAASDGATYDITVDAPAEAGIPQDAELRVSEIVPGTVEYDACLAQALHALGENPTADSMTQARFFDIKIISGEEEVQPKAAVDVNIKLSDALETDSAWKVIHFDYAGPVVMESETVATDQVDEVEMAFTTEGFSVYGVITVPTAQPDPGVNDLDGQQFTISHDSRYVTTSITPIQSGNSTNGFGKTSSSSGAATWYFERPAGSSGNTYYIYTMVDGQKQYMNLTKNNNNTDRANASLSETPQTFTVTKDGNSYRLATQSNGTTYYLDEHNGNSGNAFAGWHGATNNGQLTLNFSNQPVMQDYGEYMTLVKYEGKYYIVNNDCSLTEATYHEANNTVEVDDPMLWQINKNNPNGHIYFNSTEVGFNGNRTASDWYRRYLDPSSETGYLEETNGSGRGHVDIDGGTRHTYDGVVFWEHHITNRSNVENNTSISIDNTTTSGNTLYHIYHGNKNSGSYLGVVTNADGTLRLAGQQSSDNAAEFVFASPTEVKQVGWVNHTVNHIDISINGTAIVSVPLAYGNYYGSTAGDAADPILTISDNYKIELSEAQMVDSGQLRITADDMKRATVTATRADNGETIHDAFYITGYSGNIANGGNTNEQVRIEGSFLVADLRGTQYETVDASQYQGYATGWGVNDYTREVRQNRKNNIVEYTVTVVKPLTYNLIDPVLGQLYDADGNALTVTVDVAFSASFNYWDSANECPAVQGATGFGGEAWTSGGIDPSDLSGMDFVLGGDADNPDSPLTALEITKVIMDESGNRIALNAPVTNYFEIYENKNATNAQKNGVVGLHVVDSLNHPVWQPDPRDATIRNDDYTYWRTKRVTVDETGSAIVFDFDATDAMYYIVEKHDEESLPETVTDKAGNEYVYVKTYFETEYVRRDDEVGTNDPYSNKTLHPHAMHITEDYTRSSTDDYAYASIPEVAGKFIKLDGQQKKEGFLEFYVYNIYRPIHDDISVNKQWQDGDGVATDWLADVTFKLRKKTVTVSGEGAEQTQTVTYSDVTKPEYISGDWSDTITVTGPDDTATWEGLPELGENESYVVIEHNIIGREGVKVSDINRDQASGAITSFKLTKDGNTHTYDVANGLLGDEGGTTINKQRKETDITLKKVEKDDLNKPNPNLLKGASFTINKFSDDSFQEKDTSWGTAGSMTVSDDKNLDGTYTVNGLFNFAGLPAGYYQLEETRCPDGHNRLTRNPTFKIEESADHKLEITLISNPDNLLRLENNKLVIIVGNTPGATLPEAGGPGTYLYTLCGLALFAAAGYIGFVSRRSSRKEVA